MRRAAIATTMAFQDAAPVSVLVRQLKHTAFAILLSSAFVCLPARGYTTGLDCPEIGPGAVPNLLSDSQAKLVSSGNSLDLANEISDLINKLQIEKPNISYAELTDVMIAAHCPVVASTASLTAADKWRRMRQFETILQQQLAANTMPPGTLIIANIPLSPAIYHRLVSQAARSGQSPAQFMAAILSQAAGN